MDYQSILFSVDEGVATITLNRPDKLNSFTDEMHGELRDAFKTIAKDETIRSVLITGAGRGFCAGQDLSHLASEEARAEQDLGETLDKNYNRLIRTIRSLPKPVVCAVNGVAAGAGANLALACDIVLAARSASFIQAFCKIGLIPDAGGTWTLPRLVGSARALALAMLGDKISAEQAHDWGMIWKAFDDETLMPEAQGMALHLATQPTQALALIKRAFNASTSNTLDQQLDLERDLQTIAGRTSDYHEGVDAFLNKRPAEFSGK